MTLEKLQSEMIQAMKNGDKFRKGILADMIGNVKKAAIDKNCRDNITEELVDEVLLKCKKTAQEMIDTCPADRVETLAEYNKQLEIINEFAPTLMTDEDVICKMIKYLMTENNIEPTKKNKGAVMKTIMPVFKGKADMKVVNKVVGDILV
jgi:uncharacterized protein YqeY